MASRLLLLAGTTEARQVAAALAGTMTPRVVASLAGATRSPVALGVPTRIGGFGGRQGFVDFLHHEGIGAVLDATHPFAARISHRSAEVCAELGLPFAQILRPAWLPGAGDDWTFLNDESDAARHIPEGARVFLSTGGQSVEAFANLSGRRLFCRRIDPPEEPFPLPGGDWVIGRAPFDLERETTLFLRLRIDWLVVRNAGGAAARPKLDAARDLGIRVAMIRRPLQPEGPKFETVAPAIAWARRVV